MPLPASQIATTSGAGDEPDVSAAISPDMPEAADASPQQDVDSGQPADNQDDSQQPLESDAQAEEVPFDEASLEIAQEFSEADYQRAIQHYAKQWKVDPSTINPADPFVKNLLRENILRGRKISELNTRVTEADESGADAEGDEPAPEPQPTQVTPEQVKKYLDGIGEIAAKSYAPEIGGQWAKDFLTIFYGEDGIKKVSPEGFKRVAEVANRGILMALDAYLPQLIPQLASRWAESQYPMLGDIHTSAVETKAAANIRAKHNDFAKMETDGSIARARAEFPEYQNATFKDVKTGKALDRLASKERELMTYYQIAKGMTVNPAIVQRAVETGKKQQERAAQVVAQGKLAAGASPSSGFRQADSNNPMPFLENPQLGSKFQRAVDLEAAKRPPRR